MHVHSGAAARNSSRLAIFKPGKGAPCPRSMKTGGGPFRLGLGRMRSTIGAPPPPENASPPAAANAAARAAVPPPWGLSAAVAAAATAARRSFSLSPLPSGPASSARMTWPHTDHTALLFGPCVELQSSPVICFPPACLSSAGIGGRGGRRGTKKMVSCCRYPAVDWLLWHTISEPADNVKAYSRQGRGTPGGRAGQM